MTDFNIPKITSKRQGLECMSLILGGVLNVRPASNSEMVKPPSTPVFGDVDMGGHEPRKGLLTAWYGLGWCGRESFLVLDFRTESWFRSKEDLQKGGIGPPQRPSQTMKH